MGNVCNDMYLIFEVICLMDKDGVGCFDVDICGKLQVFKQKIDDVIKFILLWVKIVVVIVFGLGIMVGWKCIVVMVGEKIGKIYLIYVQGVLVEIVVMLIIGVVDLYGLLVFIIYVLFFGVVGIMVVNGLGLQWKIICNLLMVWVLMLLVVILFLVLFYWLFIWLF